jgi:peptidoglycan hydrolase CwlO-like protein
VGCSCAVADGWVPRACSPRRCGEAPARMPQWRRTQPGRLGRRRSQEKARSPEAEEEEEEVVDAEEEAAEEKEAAAAAERRQQMEQQAAAAGQPAREKTVQLAQSTPTLSLGADATTAGK